MVHRENPSRRESVVALGGALVLAVLVVFALVPWDDAPAAARSTRHVAPTSGIARSSTSSFADRRLPPETDAARDASLRVDDVSAGETTAAERFPHEFAAITSAQALLDGHETSSAAQSLEQAEGKLIAKVEKQIAKSEAKIAKLEGVLATKEDQLAQRELDLLDAEDQLDLVDSFLELAEQDLADALALPETTDEQIAAKAAAVATAQLGVKLATKEVAAATKQVTAIEKAITKLESQIESTEDKIADAEDLLASQEDDLALLESPFDFVADEDVPFSILVQDDGSQPVVGARVVLTDVLPAPKGKQAVELLGSGAVYWQGLTGSDGRCATTLRLLPSLDALDVIVDADGLVGPYSAEAHRERAGDFAPSARVGVARDDLASTVVTLEDAP